ncbi:hypothetical protein QYE76_064042 [Lolium multiflorum]|uniref:Retrotransposon gag domain-containing protein n=1 Tax=Lolium multiflorum TaxID=4521 RepID=A0AAD8S654_LOLMU|nr:hypothetical protein QYE76_064042 [Lolium multiflorum]
MPSWPQFKECCNLRFGPPIRINPLGEIARMRQSGTVTEYVEKFLSPLAHNDPLTTKQQVQLFTSGLTDLLHVDVEMQKPLDLQVAMSMARAYEQRATIMATSSKENSSMAIRQPQGMSLKGTVGEERILRQLTATEMAERKEKGLCFSCDGNSQEATDVSAFSNLKLLMMLRRTIRHELHEDKLCLHGGVVL